MKRAGILFMFICLLIGSCASYQQTKVKRAKTKHAYLQFINTKGDYPDGVEVYINTDPAYISLVTADKSGSTKKDRWPVRAGKVKLKVVYEGTVVYKDSVVLEQGKTTQIELPDKSHLF